MALLGLLADTCTGCRAPGPSPCRGCVARLHPAPPLVAPAPLASLQALVRYEGPAAQLVVGLKNRHDRSAVPWLASGCALLLPRRVDLVTWAPTSRRRAARRGYDHAQVLAAAIGAAAGVRVHRTVRRTTATAQHGRSRGERLDGPAFTPLHALDGLVVVVVDDVTATGATLGAAGGAVLAAGAREVHGVCVAAVPDVRIGPIGTTSAD